jgi:hypothetical protein
MRKCRQAQAGGNVFPPPAPPRPAVGIVIVVDVPTDLIEITPGVR